MAVVDLENGQDDYVPKDDNRSDTSDESEIVGKKGLHLRWSRLVKSVEIREQNSGLLRGSISTPSHQSHEDFKKSGTQTKTILNEVSGTASPGEVLALMGPSGSGKTSLIDVLAGRSEYQSGEITVDGEVVTHKIMKKLKKRVAYVKQSDLFFGHLTVRDQLTYTALLRLPSSVPKSRKLTEVDRIINRLRLNKCADSPIYMVSGGERKRVNIGTELLTDPAVIMLDEPTSGLDSTSAVALIKILNTLAHSEGKTIITSIHQPSSAVFASFNKLMLLADGHVVYYGTPQGSLTYAANLNFACPSGYNSADHWMDLLVVDSAIVASESEYVNVDGSVNQNKLAGANVGKTPKNVLISAWDKEAQANDVDSKVKADRADRNSASAVESWDDKPFNSTWWTQFTVLMHRSMKNSRSAIFTTLNLIKAGLIGLMVGLLWFQMPYTEATVFDRSSYYFFTMTFWVFDAMFTSFMSFPQERTIMLKERASGSYHLSAYFLAKTTSEAPARMVLPAIYMIISYWMAGVNNNFGIFLGSTMCTLLSVLAGESLGLLVGTTVFDIEKGMVVLTVCSLAMMVVGGFFVQNLSGWMSWLKFLSPFKYAYDSSVQLVFNRPIPCDGSSVLEACAGGNSGFATPADAIHYLGVQGSVGFNVGMLLVVFVVARFVSFLALRAKKAAEREA
jgi:ABC-type multidrug transport system ATPase subunit/ABC-type multidrug transport system permease subunit